MRLYKAFFEWKDFSFLLCAAKRSRAEHAIEKRDFFDRQKRKETKKVKKKKEKGKNTFSPLCVIDAGRRKREKSAHHTRLARVPHLPAPTLNLYWSLKLFESHTLAAHRSGLGASYRKWVSLNHHDRCFHKIWNLSTVGCLLKVVNFMIRSNHTVTQRQASWMVTERREGADPKLWGRSFHSFSSCQ